MFTAALFSIAKTWKQPKYPSTDEWIKMWGVCVCVCVCVCVYVYMYICICMCVCTQVTSIMPGSLRPYGL